MSIKNKIALRTLKRTLRNRNKMMSRGTKFRISVFRSLKNIGAQIIDDANHNTVLSLSSQNIKNLEGDKKAIARHIGIELAKKAVASNIQEVFFDRGGYKYHGRVQAFADGLREGGLLF